MIVKKIANKLKQFYNKNDIYSRVTHSFIDYFRKATSIHNRNNHKPEKSSYNNGNHHTKVEKSFFTSANGKQLWTTWPLNHETNKLRLELVESNTAEVLKYIIEKNIGTGNITIADGWNGYSFLDIVNSRYIHHTYNHGEGLF